MAREGLKRGQKGGPKGPKIPPFRLVLRTKWPKRAQKGVQKGPLFEPSWPGTLLKDTGIGPNGLQKGVQKGPILGVPGDPLGGPGGPPGPQMYAFNV